MKKKVLFLAVSFAIILITSCKENSTEPPQKPFKNPREMTWTADTLETGDPNQLQLIPENLLVFSPNDAWLCCWADGPLGQMWRYDGKDWLVNDILKDVSGKPKDIAGASSNNLFAGGYIGDNVFIAKYNGINWIDVYPGFYTVDPSKWLKGDILDMSTDANGNIWACGRNGLVMKYENNKWIADTVQILNYELTDYFLKSIEIYNGKAHLLASIYGTSYAYLTGDIKNWTLVDTMRLNSPSSTVKWGNMGLFNDPGKNIYSYGLQGIWKLNDNSWTKIFDFDGEIYGMTGVDKEYLICVSGYKSVYFFDGTSWTSIGNLFDVDDPTFEFKNVWTNGYEIIIAGFGTFNGIDKTIIWHGK